MLPDALLLRGVYGSLPTASYGGDPGQNLAHACSFAPVKKSENIKLSRWPRNTGVFERAPVARKARATEQRSLARRGNAKPSRRPERRMLISRRLTICSRSCGTRQLRQGVVRR